MSQYKALDKIKQYRKQLKEEGNEYPYRTAPPASDFDSINNPTTQKLFGINQERVPMPSGPLDFDARGKAISAASFTGVNPQITDTERDLLLGGKYPKGESVAGLDPVQTPGTIPFYGQNNNKVQTVGFKPQDPLANNTQAPSTIPSATVKESMYPELYALKKYRKKLREGILDSLSDTLHRATLDAINRDGLFDYDPTKMSPEEAYGLRQQLDVDGGASILSGPEKAVLNSWDEAHPVQATVQQAEEFMHNHPYLIGAAGLGAGGLAAAALLGNKKKKEHALGVTENYNTRLAEKIRPTSIEKYIKKNLKEFNAVDAGDWIQNNIVDPSFNMLNNSYTTIGSPVTGAISDAAYLAGAGYDNLQNYIGNKMSAAPAIAGTYDPTTGHMSGGIKDPSAAAFWGAKHVGVPAGMILGGLALGTGLWATKALSDLYHSYSWKRSGCAALTSIADKTKCEMLVNDSMLSDIQTKLSQCTTRECMEKMHEELGRLTEHRNLLLGTGSY